MTGNSSKLSEHVPGSLRKTQEGEIPGDQFAADLRGFGLTGILSILVIVLPGNVFVGDIFFVPVSGILALLWVWRSRTPWRAIGYVRPHSWIGVLGAGLAFGIGFKFLMKSIVMPLFVADPVNHAYHFLAGNKAMLPVAIWSMIVAGFAEETVFRGFLFERFGKLFGPGVWPKTLTVLLTSGVFALGHYTDQGMAGVQQATITGLVFGTIYAITGRIWMVIFAHAAFDLIAIGMIYWNFESQVGHLFTR